MKEHVSEDRCMVNGKCKYVREEAQRRFEGDTPRVRAVSQHVWQRLEYEIREESFVRTTIRREEIYKRGSAMFRPFVSNCENIYTRSKNLPCNLNF